MSPCQTGWLGHGQAEWQSWDVCPGGLAPYATLWTTLLHPPGGTCGPVHYCTHTHQQWSDVRGSGMYGSQERRDLVWLSLTVRLGASTSPPLASIFIHLHNSAGVGEGEMNIPSTSKSPQQSTRPDKVTRLLCDI